MVISGCIAAAVAAAQHGYTFNVRETCAFRPQHTRLVKASKSLLFHVFWWLSIALAADSSTHLVKAQGGEA